MGSNQTKPLPVNTVKVKIPPQFTQHTAQSSLTATLGSTPVDRLFLRQAWKKALFNDYIMDSESVSLSFAMAPELPAEHWT